MQEQEFDFVGDWMHILRPMVSQCAGDILDLALQIVQTLDTIISEIIVIVNDYMQRIANAKFCWRTPSSLARQWVHPKSCPAGRIFSFGQGCIKEGSASLLHLDKAVSLKDSNNNNNNNNVDQATTGKGQPEPWVCKPPTCGAPACASDKEQGELGGKVVCFDQTCPTPYVVDSSKRTECVMPCPSRLPHQVGLICAENAAVGTSTIVDMIIGTLTNLVDALKKVTDLVVSETISDVQSKMPDTLNSLAKVGHAFLAENCKDVHAE